MVYGELRLNLRQAGQLLQARSAGTADLAQDDSNRCESRGQAVAGM
jgi:hypothetical protein